jgi:quercetin dioxygenase-like cupin family protein
MADERPRAYALNADEGWTYRAGIDFMVKARERRPGPGFACLVYTTRAGEEPEDHTHDTEDEVFYVIEGEISFRCGDQTFDLEDGGFIFLPRGVQHGYKIRSERHVDLLVITAPPRNDAVVGGWGGFIGDLEQGEPQGSPPE